MTIPQFDDTPTENLGGGEKRDPSEFVPWDRVAEVVTPRGTRPGLVMIVRPLERIKDYRDKDPENDWKTLVIADIAILDPIPPGFDQYQMPLSAIEAGSQWRNQLVFPGMLNKAWRDKIGGTLIGMVYFGQPKQMANGTMGKPPFLWRSLTQDQAAVARGQSFMRARPEFLVRVPREAATAADTSWATSTTPNPGYTHAAPAPQTAPTQGYPQGQPDPWAQQPAQAVAPAQAQDPRVGLSALEQMRQAAATGAQGDIPF